MKNYITVKTEIKNEVSKLNGENLAINKITFKTKKNGEDFKRIGEAKTFWDICGTNEGKTYIYFKEDNKNYYISNLKVSSVEELKKELEERKETNEEKIKDYNYILILIVLILLLFFCILKIIC